MIGDNVSTCVGLPHLYNSPGITTSNVCTIRRPCNSKYTVIMAMIYENGDLNRHHLVFSRSLDKKIDTMGQHRQNILQALFHRFGTAGKIENESTTAHACDTSGKHTERRMLETYGTHSFSDARSLAVDDSLCRLWRDITWSQSCTTRCENEIKMFVIAPFAQCCLNQFAFIRDNCACANDGFW